MKIVNGFYPHKYLAGTLNIPRIFQYGIIHLVRTQDFPKN